MIIIQSILTMLEYSHGNEVIHKNLRPEKVLVQHGEEYATLQVVHFGVGSLRSEKSELFDESYGFPHYASP